MAIPIFVFHGFGLVKLHDRSICLRPLSNEIKECVNNECNDTDPEKCAKYGMKLTCKLFKFTKKNDIANGKANCVGYAQLCSEICNYAMSHNGISYRTKPVVGYVTFYGIDLCKILKTIVPNKYKNFVKDHDFVEMDLGDKYMYFDASLFDFYINCTTYVKK